MNDPQPCQVCGTLTRNPDRICDCTLACRQARNYLDRRNTLRLRPRLRSGHDLTHRSVPELLNALHGLFRAMVLEPDEADTFAARGQAAIAELHARIGELRKGRGPKHGKFLRAMDTVPPVPSPAVEQEHGEPHDNRRR